MSLCDGYVKYSTMQWKLYGMEAFIGKNNLNNKQTSTHLSVIIFTILIWVVSKNHAKNRDPQKFWLMFCLLKFFVATLGVKLCFWKWLLILKATSFFTRVNLERCCCVNWKILCPSKNRQVFVYCFVYYFVYWFRKFWKGKNIFCQRRNCCRWKGV